MLSRQKVDLLSTTMREKAIRPQFREILLANFSGTDQAKDASKVNCNGFGRIRTLMQQPRPNWVGSCVRYRVGAAKLNLSDEESELCQVFQTAVCNFRCWFCYVDTKLLCGDLSYSQFINIDLLLDSFLTQPQKPRIIALSGGQPDLIPEWTPWFIEGLIKRGMENRFYIWVDDNLSTYFAWKFLDDYQWELLKTYRNLGKLCGIKSFSRERFSENSNVAPDLFDRQIDILSRQVKEGLDVYIELALTTSNLKNVAKDISSFMDLMQNRVHPNILLRVNPTEIRLYTPTRSRLTKEREIALHNQYTVLEIWLEELSKRYSSSEIAMPQHLVSLK